MDVEKILRKIPKFSQIKLDVILFEGAYPILFTCENGSEIYMFICCEFDGQNVKWIASKTDYKNLINLLKDRISIRESFLNGANTMFAIDFNGVDIFFKELLKSEVDSNILPSDGQYMKAEEGEFSEEIFVFEERLG